MPFSQIRYILLAHRSSEKTDTGQRIDTPLNPLPTSKDLQKSFTVGFGKTGAPAYGRRRKGIGPANKIDRRRAPPERCNYDFGTFGGTEHRLQIMSDKNGEECWYALKVFYNRVFELEKQLSQEGVRSYIPLLHEDTVAGDKKIRKRKPAVSSLMFIRQSEHYLLELQDRMKASCPFMAYFDRETKKPAVIPDREMELFMQITSADTSDLEYFSDEAIDYRSGDKVRVTGGPFKGAEGYIKRIRGNRRLIVALEGVIAVATTYIPGCFLEKTSKN